MNKRLKLTRLAAFLIVLAMLIGSFPAVYSEELEVTEEVPAEVVEVTEPEPADPVQPSYADTIIKDKPTVDHSSENEIDPGPTD